MQQIILTIVQVNEINLDSETLELESYNKVMLDYAAKSSLTMGGFVAPPVLLSKGTEINRSYDILSGHFQCAAAQIAQKIDPVKGKTVPAIVIHEDDQYLKMFCLQLEDINFYVVR